MLSKTATMLLGLINSEPLNAYELSRMGIKFKQSPPHNYELFTYSYTLQQSQLPYLTNDIKSH